MGRREGFRYKIFLGFVGGGGRGWGFIEVGRGVFVYILVYEVFVWVYGRVVRFWVEVFFLEGRERFGIKMVLGVGF